LQFPLKYQQNLPVHTTPRSGKLLLTSVKSTKLYGNLAQINMSVNKPNEGKALTVKENERFELFLLKMEKGSI
jgi:hypothetical protein